MLVNCTLSSSFSLCRVKQGRDSSHIDFSKHPLVRGIVSVLVQIGCIACLECNCMHLRSCCLQRLMRFGKEGMAVSARAAIGFDAATSQRVTPFTANFMAVASNPLNAEWLKHNPSARHAQETCR